MYSMSDEIQFDGESPHFLTNSTGSASIEEIMESLKQFQAISEPAVPRRTVLMFNPEDLWKIKPLTIEPVVKDYSDTLDNLSMRAYADYRITRSLMIPRYILVSDAAWDEPISLPPRKASIVPVVAAVIVLTLLALALL